MNSSIDSEQDKPSLLIVDDDVVFCEVLSDSFTHRGYSVRTAQAAVQALELAREDSPEYALVDLCMPGSSGLELVQELIKIDENTRIVMLTGYASVATAVEAIKLGAVHYLAKPADTDEIETAFFKDEGDATLPIKNKPLSVARLEWEHIQKVLGECGGNISQTARRLNMHRRTLQRKLSKRPVKE
jgi:two-component system response regulator RegA